jgi:hypothetical protein
MNLEEGLYLQPMMVYSSAASEHNLTGRIHWKKSIVNIEILRMAYYILPTAIWTHLDESTMKTNIGLPIREIFR